MIQEILEVLDQKATMVIEENQVVMENRDLKEIMAIK